MKNTRAASPLLIVSGALVIGFALAADALGVGGAPGIGPRQVLLMAVGAALMAMGLVLARVGQPVRTWIAARWFGCPPLSAVQCIVVGVWVGLATGIVEVLHSGILKYGFGRLLKQPEHLVWMAPCSYAFLFGVAGMALALLGMRWARAITLPCAIFLLVVPSAWSQLLMHPQIASWAVAVVCLGTAAQAARWSARHAETLPRAIGRTLVWLVGLVLVAGLTVTVLRAFAHRDASASHSAPDGAPNVLLIVLDTVRADHLALYGYHRVTTPNIEKLAEDAVTFEWALSTAPWTLPSHASMFTGRYHHEMNADWVIPLDDTHPTLAEVLSAQGFATAGFVGNLVYCLREHGIARGFAHYEDIQVNAETLVLSTSVGRYLASLALGVGVGELATNDAETVTELFLDWLPSRGDRPFFAFLNYIDAHALYLAPERFRDSFGDPGPNIHQWYDRSDWTDAEMQQFRNAYDSCIAFIDEQVGRVVAELRRQGLLQNTVILITSDHGEHFGEHGLTDHGNSLYRELLHVPLLIRMPGQSQSVSIKESVSLRDLPSTILDLVEVAPSTPFPGRSLRRFWTDGASAAEDDTLLLSEISRGINTPDHEPRSKGDMKSLFRDRMHYIRNGDRNDELYDLRKDPREQENLIDQPSARGPREDFRRVLDLLPEQER